jgi:hypothetical protein
MSFGAGDFVKLFDDFGDTETFSLVPAVRHATGGSCVDENGCDYEKITLCAFQNISQAKQVSFLACMDEKRTGTPESCAKSCATEQDLHYDVIDSCFNSQEGDDLLAAASEEFNAALPGSTTIPHTFVNEDDISPSYNALKGALCKAGSTASVCSSKASASSCTV